MNCICGRGKVKRLGNSGQVYACDRCGLIYLTEAEKASRRRRGLFVPATPTMEKGVHNG